MATTIVYPDADPESTSVDGLAFRNNGGSETLAVIRAGAGSSSNDDNASNAFSLRLVASSTTDEYQTLNRSFYLFDTSGISVEDTIDSATLSLYGAVTKDNGLGEFDVHICSSSPASNTALVAADYGTVGDTSFGSMAWADYSVSAYNDISLNSSGISNITKGGISKFGERMSWDIDNNFTGTWVSAQDSRVGVIYADTAGTTQDPKLTIEHDLYWYTVIS